MPTYSISIMVGGNVKLSKTEGDADEAYSAEVQINRPVLSGIEILGEDGDVSLGKEGGRVAAIALLELAAEKIRKGSDTPSSDTPEPSTNVPGADA